MDNFLCFSGLVHQAFFSESQAIARRVEAKGRRLVSYSDNFIIKAVDDEKALKGQQFLLSLLSRLGFAIKWEKLVWLSTRVQFFEC